MKKIIACALCAIIIIATLAGCTASKYTYRRVEEGEKPDIISTEPDGTFLEDKERDYLLNKAIREYFDSIEIDSSDFTYEIAYSIQGSYKDEWIMLYWVIITDSTGAEHFEGFIIK